uniref:MoaD/ThiS family protein n=1 Tax=Ignisphaera aggregans TaxID=334771 RepID=A0A7C2VH61_9CREN
MPVQGDEPLTNLLERLKMLYPGLRDVIDSIKELAGEYILLINGVDANVYGDIESIKIKDDDIITLVPIAHGGSSST